MASPSTTRSALPRTALIALIAIVAAAFAATMAISATPSSGTIDQAQTTPFPWSGQVTGRALATACQPEDSGSLPQCDSFELTVDIDPIFWGGNDGGLEVGAANSDAADTDDDLNILVYDKDGALVSSPSSSGPGEQEKVAVKEASRAGSPYRVVVYETGVGTPDAGTVTYDAGARIEARAKAPNDGAVSSDAPIPTEIVTDEKCVDGLAAGVFPCKGVDLDGFVPISGLGSEGLTGELNDIWGWTDPETGKEYALVGKFNGTAFVDVSDPKAPKYLGELPTFGAEDPVFNIWRDIKTYKNNAYIVSEEPGHGMQVFDLTQLRDVTSPQTFVENPLTHYAGFGNAHNISINEQTGFAYVIGTNTCSGGSSILDLNNMPPAASPPVCVSGDGYTHDNQCVIYDGPDEDHTGKEICFDYNEDSVTIQDVTDKANPKMLSRTEYSSSQYTHQGWLTEDQRHVLFNDELDEQGNGTNTTTRILNIENLDGPTLVPGDYVHPTKAIDHNNYIKGDRAYQANYRAGLRILDISKVATGDLSTEAFFDVYPADDDGEFNGSWSTYPYFKSGTVIVSGIEQGLFVLSEQRNAPATTPEPDPTPTNQEPDPTPTNQEPDSTPTTTTTTTSTSTTAPPAPPAGNPGSPSTPGTAPGSNPGSTGGGSVTKPSVGSSSRKQARVRLTRRVLTRGRVKLGCTVRGATKRSCVVRLYVRKGKRLALVRKASFSSRTTSATVRLRKRRNLVMRATAKTTTGKTLRAARTLRFTKRSGR